MQKKQKEDQDRDLQRKTEKPSGAGLPDGAVKVLFVIYILVLLKVIVFKLPLETMRAIMDSWTREVVWEGMESANFEPFRTIRMYIRYWGTGLNSFENLVGNVAAFIPLGYFLPRVATVFQNVLVCMSCALLFVTGIELFQLLSAFGAFDVDDIILNCLGALLGYIFFILCKTFRKRNSSN